MLGLDDLTLGIIQVYFSESGLTRKEYVKYMNKQFKGINLRVTKNQLGWTEDTHLAKKRFREIKKQMQACEDSFGTLYRSLERFKQKTIRKRRGGRSQSSV